MTMMIESRHKTMSTKALLIAVAIACATSTSTEAFAPVAPSANTKATTAASKAYTPLDGPAAPRAPTMLSRSPTGSATSLHMIAGGGAGGNFFERFFRVFNANLNSAISKIENPEKLITQAVTEMQNDLVRIRQAYAEAVATQRRLERQKQTPDQQAEYWYRRANLALKAGNEGLAREALARRQTYIDQSKAVEKQLDVQTNATDKLYTAMQQLEGKIQEAASKRQQLIARARTAKTTQQVNDMLSGLTGKTSMDAFNRMESKVEALEAAAEASAEMALLPKASDTVEADFRRLEQSSQVDNELQKLKMDMKLLSASTSSSMDSGFAERKSVKIPVINKEENKIYLS